MASMLEVMREYKHLAAKKRAEGALPPSLEERLIELEGVVKANRQSDGDEPRTKPGSTADTKRAKPPDAAPTNSDTQHRRSMARLKAPVSTSPSQGPRAPREAIAPSSPAEPAQKQREPAGPAPDPPRADPVDRVSPIDRVLVRLPRPFSKRASLMLAGVGGVVAIAMGIMVIGGVPLDRAYSSVLPALVAICGPSWFGLYPALVFWREHVANQGEAHINEPDFEARPAQVEPLVGMLTILSLVIYIWLGGHTNEGVLYVSAMLVGFTLACLGFALGAVLTLRPIALAKVQARALRQYLEGGLHHLNKGNPKRARRLLERAHDLAFQTPKAAEIAKHLRAATQQEADELRQKGFDDKADELVRAQAERPRKRAPQWGTRGADNAGLEPRIAGSGPPEAAASDKPLGPPTRPRLMQPEMIAIEKNAIGSPAPGSEEAEVRERVRALARKGRSREAFELLVQSRLPAPPDLAEDATKEYIAEGFIRSADAIFEALGKRQIPEFYKAVAAEWSRDSGGDPPPEVCTRLATILSELGEGEAAARIACRGALSKRGAPAARQESGALALELCKELKIEPPAELLESTGDFATAARLYEQDGKSEEALRCYRAATDRALERADPPSKVIPLLSKLFLNDQNLADKYLEPLAQHVIETKASGPVSIRILATYRRRKKSDARVSLRLVELYIEVNQQDDAFVELEQLASGGTSNPEGLVRVYQAFVERYADHLKARSAYVRTLLKLGRIEDAAQQVRAYVQRSAKAKANPADAIALLVLILDWGHADNDLRKQLGLLRLQKGEVERGLADLQQYVDEGGRDPEVLSTVKGLLGERLALPNGAPDYEGLLRLGRFLLNCGDPDGALVHLERVRASKEHKKVALPLLARAHSARGEDDKAAALLKGAIAGRPIADTLELHDELARAHEALGNTKEAARIARAIVAVHADFRSEYEKARPRSDRSDTAWTPEGDFDEKTEDELGPLKRDSTSDVAPSATDDVEELTEEPAPVRSKATSSRKKKEPMGSSLPPPGEDEFPVENKFGAEQDESERLSSALLPRYRLRKRLGAGGMGEVHLAEDVDLGRKVAIKVLRRSLATDLFLAKFREEARIVAQLAHPNIVAIYDLGMKGNWSYIVMEYVDGPDLATLMRRPEGFEQHRLLRIIAGAAEAMSYAHSRAVIHRDLKPANILVGPKDLVKVTDFGIAKVLQPDNEQETAFSAAGLQVGTVNYMAPEQIAGTAVDPRTDIYLLGTTLYTCLASAFPYGGEAVAIQKLKQDPVPVSSRVDGISSALDAIIMKCLRRRPDERYQSMAELAEALRDLPESQGN